MPDIPCHFLTISTTFHFHFPPAQLDGRIYDEKYVGLNKLQMMPRPNASNLIEVLNTQVLTDKSSDKIGVS